MGFSVSLASTIIIIGMVATAGVLAGTMFQITGALYETVEVYGDLERTRLDVRLELEIVDIEARELNITVSNIGSRTIFLASGQDYKFNTVIISYDGHSYIVEDYEILEIRVSGSNAPFDPASHLHIAPGEEALLKVEIPDGAPDIPAGGVVSAVFASHYGVSAADEGVRPE